MSKYVLLNLGSGSVQTGFDDITVQVWSDISPGPSNQYGGSLPAHTELARCYQLWQDMYPYYWPQTRGIPFDRDISHFSAIEFQDLNRDISNFSVIEFQDLCTALKGWINAWLSTEDFSQRIAQPLREYLNSDDDVQFILESSDHELVRRLPLHLWQFFQDYPKAELVISEREWRTVHPSQTQPGIVRILAVFGDKTGLNLGDERNFLLQLEGAEVCFLDEPKLEDLVQALTSESWDILFFAGHSQTKERTGWIRLNSEHLVSVKDLEQELNIAIKNGLQLAIFNSCDGLGIAEQLGKLNMPHVIVMREPILDHLAQTFLRHLLEQLAAGLPLYIAVREARQILSRLTEFPCASWLPVIFKNPTAICPTWTSLRFYRPYEGICPYQGLSYFDCNDKDPNYFVGREKLVNSLITQAQKSNFITLVGASGSGKSSVLRAGLIHQLKLGQKISDSDQWQVIITRPDLNPFQNLALAFVDDSLIGLERADAFEHASNLVNLGGVGLYKLIQQSFVPRTILIIDQFEELFTHCKTLKIRETFCACLMEALSRSPGQLCIIIAMRADFLGRCLARDYSGLAIKISSQLINVVPLNPKELKDAIIQPLQKVGIEIEPALTSAILNDMADSPGNLSLLQFTLRILWQRRSNHCLTLESYEALGGIAGSLNKRATEIYNACNHIEQNTIRHIFLQLTQLGEGGEDTHRSVFKSDLVSAPRYPYALVEDVIERLSNHQNRLLVTNEDSSTRMAIVDVAHKSLIRSWELLRQWIEEDRDLLRQQCKIESKAITWRSQGKQSGDLLQGVSLDKAIQFKEQQGQSFPLSDAARFFIKKSRTQRFINKLRMSCLLLPALITIGVLEYNLREVSIKLDYARLNQEGTNEQQRAAQNLVKGCQHQGLPRYFRDRLYGHCRSLSRTSLIRANLSGVDLSGVDLSSVDLSSADLSSANLHNANLSSANLHNANLSSADLSGVNLSSVNLSNAKLSSAHLHNANLSSADLSSADLSSANLHNANLSSADLSSANLHNVHLSNADLNSANLHNAHLSYANLFNTNLSDVNFSYATLRGINLSNTHLSNTIFFTTDLRNVKGLTEQRLQSKYIYFCHSPLPASIRLDHNRDCHKLGKRLYQRSTSEFDSIEKAQQYVQGRMQINSFGL